MDPLVGLFDPSGDDGELCEMPESLPPEIEEGNIEYKLKLVNPSESRFEHLVTQMKWRLQEGQGEAIYEIGVEDNGLLAGLTEHELDASLYTLSRMAKRLGADISIIREKNIETATDVRQVAEVLVRKVPDNQQFIDLRLAVLGNVDAGKSTLLGVLTQGELDNGHGRARLNLFRHLHEIQSGRTSSISHEILGFNTKGEVVNYSEARNVEEICENSTKLITLIDLCGHHKYMKTTIFGLTGYSPDFAMLVVSANTGIVGTTKEHLGFALALGVPIFVVVSKVDMCRRAQVERTTRQLEKILKGPGCKKIPFRVESVDDAVTAASTFHNERTNIRRSMARSQENLLECLGVTRSANDVHAPTCTTSATQSQCPNLVQAVSHHSHTRGQTSSEPLVVTSSEPQVVTSIDQQVVTRSESQVVTSSEHIKDADSTPTVSPVVTDTRQCRSGHSDEQYAVNCQPEIEDTTSQCKNDDSANKCASCRSPEIDDIKQCRNQHEMDENASSSRANKTDSGLGRPEDEETVLFTYDECESICPIFAVSSVSGKNLDLLTKFLNVLPPLLSTKEREQFMQELAEHQIDEVYSIQGVGVVAGGTVLRGTIKEGDSLLLGPCNDGHFLPVTISTIQRNRLACRQVSAGQSCSLSVGNNQLPARKGMVLVSPELNPAACIEFEADIYVLFHTHSICRGFQTVIHVGNVRQTATIVKMSKSCVQTNEKAVVTFRFINRPEYIRVGSRLLFREGRTKGMGEITKIHPVTHVENPCPTR